jgi:cellulose synthase operon protein C
VKRLIPAGACALLLTSWLSAQSIEQAEALRKARRFDEANTMYRALDARNPKSPDIKTRWGRLYLDVGQLDGDNGAQSLFTEAIALDEKWAPAYLGLALIAEDSFQGSAAELARKALSYDPKLVEAQALLAQLALEDNDDAKAAAEAQKALKLDANSVQAKAILASIDFLADKTESSWDPRSADGYETIGRMFVINRRYEEGIAYLRKAVALNPSLYSARSQLGINLMRMGQDEEAYDQLKTCYDNRFQDHATTNSLALLDTLRKFDTFESPGVTLRLDKKESALLRPYFEAEVRRAEAAYEKKYRFKLQHPVRVEAYPNHEDFAVRTLGMPGLGALGVTFGYSIAMDSPSGRSPGSFHWASTLWHEMSHVYTLAMTNSRVPRWFTEGIAVYEETAVSPEWGDRLTPEVITAIKEKSLLPISELDRGFIHPKNQIQVSVSYFQGGQIVDYITGKYGWDAILAMLKDFSEGQDTPAVIRKELKVEPADFDKAFVAWVEGRTRREVDNFESWRTQLKTIAAEAKAKDDDGVIRTGLAIRDLYPDYVETGSVYEFLARAYLNKQDKKAAAAELERYVKAGGRDPEILKLAAQLLAENGNKQEAAAVLERMNYIYLMDMDQHQTLGTLLLDQGNAKDAIREFEAVLDYKPLDPAEAHYNLARAYRMNKQIPEAKDELLLSLEAAPSYRAAQKMLLELAGAEQTGTAPEKVPN